MYSVVNKHGGFKERGYYVSLLLTKHGRSRLKKRFHGSNKMATVKKARSEGLEIKDAFGKLRSFMLNKSRHHGTVVKVYKGYIYCFTREGLLVTMYDLPEGFRKVADAMVEFRDKCKKNSFKSGSSTVIKFWIMYKDYPLVSVVFDIDRKTILSKEDKTYKQPYNMKWILGVPNSDFYTVFSAAFCPFLLRDDFYSFNYNTIFEEIEASRKKGLNGYWIKFNNSTETYEEFLQKIESQY